MRSVEDVEAALRSTGKLSEAQIATMVEDHRRRAEALGNGLCPKCGGPSTRRVDPRQAGVGRHDGEVWVNYRCKNRCGFALDSVEPAAEG